MKVLAYFSSSILQKKSWMWVSNKVLLRFHLDTAKSQKRSFVTILSKFSEIASEFAASMSFKHSTWIFKNFSIQFLILKSQHPCSSTILFQFYRKTASKFKKKCFSFFKNFSGREICFKSWIYKSLQSNFIFLVNNLSDIYKSQQSTLQRFNYNFL